MRRVLLRLAKHESGQAMSEFVVVFPWVLIFIMMIMQFASIWEAFQLVNVASFQAARNAVVSPGVLQPIFPGTDTGNVDAAGLSAMELAAELVMIPVSPSRVGDDNARVAFRCATGAGSACLGNPPNAGRALPALPNTGIVAGTPTYTPEILALVDNSDEEMLHHKYIYAHNLTTSRLIEVDDALTNPLGINGCNRDAATFVGDGLSAAHIVPNSTLGSGFIAVETTYMLDMFVPLGNWVLFGTYVMLQSTRTSTCPLITDETVSFPDNTVWRENDFGPAWGGHDGGAPPWDTTSSYWGRVRRLDFDVISDYYDLIDELANPIRPRAAATRFIPRGIIEEFVDYLDEFRHYTIPLRTRTLMNLQAMDDFLDRDGDGIVDEPLLN